MADSEIILAFSKEEVTERIVKMLGAGGLHVRGICRSAAEALRMAADVKRSIIITGFKLPDMTAEQMFSELPPDIGMIVIAKGQQRELIADDDIVFMPLPVSKDELCRTVRMAAGRLSGGWKKHPRPVRTEEEKKIVEQAKAFLMEEHMMSEMQAHRFIQKQSMDNGLRFIDMARRIAEQDD
jgi:response regulator NasT